jgi:hypothetical protein
LADRQGLLVGRRLSVVQHKGSIVLDWLERRDRAEADLSRLKEALVASGNWKPQTLFPERFEPEVIESPEVLDVETDQGKLGVDYSAVEWKFGSEAEDEYKTLMAEVGKLTQGRITGDQVAARGPDEGWR